jgi:hypothetical protein
VFVGHEKEHAEVEAAASEAAPNSEAADRQKQTVEQRPTAEDDAATGDLAEEPASASFEAGQEENPDQLEPVGADEVHDRDQPSPGTAPAAPAGELAARVQAPVDPLGLDQISDEVSFAPEPRRWWVGIAMTLGMLALIAQIFWYQFDSWGRDPTLRPVYGFICDLAGCELPVLRELSALQTQKLLVRSHPELADALIVDAVIVNDAAFAQPFPVLELRFTTIDGNLVARRGFKPEEYLAGELAGATLMAPKTPVRLALEITDPGGDAVNYFLSFR